MDHAIPVGDKRRFESDIGPGSAKNRYMIIVAKLERHMLALPITSCSGRGVAGKGDGLLKEFIGIRVAGDMNYVNNAFYPPLELYDDGGTFRTKAESHVHFVGPICVEYNQEGTSMAGNISSASFERLAELFAKHMSRAMSFATRETPRPVIDADGFTTVSGSRSQPRRSSMLGSGTSGNSTASKFGRMLMHGSTLHSVTE